MQAYVTLLSSDDYLPAVLILNRNLKELNSAYPLFVMVTDKISEKTIEYLKKEDILFQQMDSLTYSEKTINHTPSLRFQSIASKINIFMLDQLDKAVYLDADCFFLKNVDDLFTYPDGALIDDGQYQGFCGMFSCIPANHPFNFYVSILKNNDVWDSDLIEGLWFPFKSNKDYHIPFAYFFNVTALNDMLYPIEKKVFGVHFCCQFKPWMFNSAHEYLFKFNQRYMSTNQTRDKLITLYFTKYLEPLKKDYPELFGS